MQHLGRVSLDPAFAETELRDYMVRVEVEACHQADRVFAITEAVRGLRELMIDHDRREILGRQARAWVVEDRDWRVIANTVDETCRELDASSAGR